PKLHEPGWRQIIEEHERSLMPTIINPTVGRVVWFWPAGSRTPDDQPLAALVCHVHGPSLVNLHVITRLGHYEAHPAVRLVQEGETPPSPEEYCCWMPYQTGQARKYEELAAKQVSEPVTEQEAALTAT